MLPIDRLRCRSRSLCCFGLCTIKKVTTGIWHIISKMAAYRTRLQLHLLYVVLPIVLYSTPFFVFLRRTKRCEVVSGRTSAAFPTWDNKERAVESGSDVISHEETGMTSVTANDFQSNTATDENDAKYKKSTQLEETNMAMNEQVFAIDDQTYDEIYEDRDVEVDSTAKQVINVETAFTLVQKRIKGRKKKVTITFILIMLKKLNIQKTIEWTRFARTIFTI